MLQCLSGICDNGNVTTRTCVVLPLVATAVSKYTAVSFAFQLSSLVLLLLYSCRPWPIQALATSVVSASNPEATSARTTSAAACRRVTASCEPTPRPAALEGRDKSRRMYSRGSSSNCSISCSDSDSVQTPTLRDKRDGLTSQTHVRNHNTLDKARDGLFGCKQFLVVTGPDRGRDKAKGLRDKL